MAGVMSKVSFASKVSVLMKTTSDDPNPTPGYLYGEVANITFESVAYCEHTLDFLLERMKKKSLHVKLKVLLVIRNVLEKGSSDFTRTLRKHSEQIKDMRSFSGPPDPLVGDSLYVNIRKAAAEILDLAFDTDRNISIPTSSNVGQLSNQPNKMEGFGVSSAAEDTTGIFNSILGRIKDVVPNIKSATSSIIEPHSSDNKDYQSYAGHEKPVVGPPSNTLWAFGNIESKTENKTGIMQPPGTINCTEPVNWLAKKNNDVNIPQPQKYQVDLHENEKKIVEEIVTPQGIRNQPTVQDMYQFCKKCGNLDCEAIVKLLSEKLTHEDTRVKLRTMSVIENLLQNNLPNILSIVKDNCTGQLKSFLTSSHIATREKAGKILRLIEQDDSSQHNTLKASDVTSGSNQSGSLLDFGFPQKNNDVFDGLQVQDQGKNSMGNPDIFHSSSIGSSSTAKKPFDIPSSNISSCKTNLLDLDLDPFGSFNQTQTSIAANTISMSSSVATTLSVHQNLLSSSTKKDPLALNSRSSVPSIGFKQSDTDLIKENTNFNSFSIDRTIENENKMTNPPLLNIVADRTEQIHDVSRNLIADFDNLSTISTSQTNDIKRNTSDDVFGILNKTEDIKHGQSLVSPSPYNLNSNVASPNSISSNLFHDLQSNTPPTTLILKHNTNTSNMGGNSSQSSNSLDSLDAFFNTSNVSNTSVRPEMNMKTRPQYQPVGNIENQSKFSNFSQQNRQQNWNQQNVFPGLMNGPNPQIQMQNNYSNVNPACFNSPNTQHVYQFQPRTVPMNARYQSPNVSQQRYVTPNVIHSNTPTNSFNFLSQKSVEGKNSNDSFNFVQDAMKASIKK